MSKNTVKTFIVLYFYLQARIMKRQFYLTFRLSYVCIRSHSQYCASILLCIVSIVLCIITSVLCVVYIVLCIVYLSILHQFISLKITSAAFITKSFYMESDIQWAYIVSLFILWMLGKWHWIEWLAVNSIHCSWHLLTV